MTFTPAVIYEKIVDWTEKEIREFEALFRGHPKHPANQPVLASTPALAEPPQAPEAPAVPSTVVEPIPALEPAGPYVPQSNSVTITAEEAAAVAAHQPDAGASQL